MKNIVVIIPAFNEDETIAGVIQTLQSQGLTQICVVNNGSCDRTAPIAAHAGASVLTESRRGYGQACWSGLQTQMAAQAEWILFCDADGSDDLSQLDMLFAQTERYDLVLGNRRGTVQGRSQLTPVQNFGNWLATQLIRLGWGYPYEDLGPLRLIRKQSLDQLTMADRGFGWTVEMQVKAVEHSLRICEQPVRYRPRQGGHSKISGTIKGSFQAGHTILTTLGSLYFQKIARTTHALGNQLRALYSTARMQRLLLGVSSFLLLVGSLLAMPHGDFLTQPEAVPLFWRGVGVMGLGFVGSWGLQKIDSRWFWLGALAPRLILLAMHPGDDIWRYLWEGHIQLAGMNPYLLAPSADVLEPLRFAGWQYINHPDHAAIYPPVAQLGFRLLSSMAAAAHLSVGASVVLFKLSFVGADVAVCWLLSRRFGYRATLLYAWNPLVIYSFAGGGHYDSWFLLPLVVAWLYGENKNSSSKHFLNKSSRQVSDGSGTIGLAQTWTQDWTQNWAKNLKISLSIGVSIAIKWMSLPVLMFLAWQCYVTQQVNTRVSLFSKKNVIVLSGAIALFLAGMTPLFLAAFPFCEGVSCPILPLESSFVSTGRSAAFLTQLVTSLWPIASQSNGIYVIPLGLALLWNLHNSHRLGHFIERYFIVLMLLSPIIHAWYFTWLIPFSVASRSWGTRLVSLSAFVYFALPHGLALGKETWTLTGLQYGALWLPFVCGIVISSIVMSEDVPSISQRQLPLNSKNL